MLTAKADMYPSELNKTVFTDRRENEEFPEFQRLLSVIQPDDCLNIPTLADLGNDLEQVSEKWQQLLKRKVRVWILDCPALQNQAQLFGEFLKYVSYSEQGLQKKRPGSHKRNASPGRPKLALPEQFPEINQEYLGGRISSREAAESLNVSHTTFLRWSRQASHT